MGCSYSFLMLSADYRTACGADGQLRMMNDELATTSQDCQGDLTLGTVGCVELFVTLKPTHLRSM